MTSYCLTVYKNSQDESDDDYDDIAELRELLRQKEERSKDLSQQIADAQALENQLHDVEPMSHHSGTGDRRLMSL